MLLNKILLGFVGTLLFCMISAAQAGENRVMLYPVEKLPSYPATHISQLPEFGLDQKIVSGPSASSLRTYSFSLLPSNFRPSIAFTSRIRLAIVVYSTFTGAILFNVDAAISQPRPETGTLSGGHEHDNSSRPVGSFDILSGNTGASGYGFQTTYTAGETSGNIEFTIFCATCIESSKFEYFQVGVPGLYPLQPADQYNLVGAPPGWLHPDNHYGTPSFVAKLAALATLYYTKYQTQSSNKLEFNDISLVTGGLYDILNNWRPDHFEHRIGISADMRLVPAARERDLREWMEEIGISGKLLVHPPPRPHWHIREYGDNQ